MLPLCKWSLCLGPPVVAVEREGVGAGPALEASGEEGGACDG